MLILEPLSYYALFYIKQQHYKNTCPNIVDLAVKCIANVDIKCLPAAWLNKASPDTDILSVLFIWGVSLFSHKFLCYTIDVPGSEATWCTPTGTFVMVYKSCCVLTAE